MTMNVGDPVEAVWWGPQGVEWRPAIVTGTYGRWCSVRFEGMAEDAERGLEEVRPIPVKVEPERLTYRTEAPLQAVARAMSDMDPAAEAIRHLEAAVSALERVGSDRAKYALVGARIAQKMMLGEFEGDES